MKIQAYWLLPTIILSFLLGLTLEKGSDSISAAHSVSQAGQTLSDLSKALEKVKNDIGEYPESIADITISASSPEFSEKLTSDIEYFKINSGYVAIIGMPHLAIMNNGEGVKYK